MQASGARQTTALPNTRSVALQAPAGRGKEVAATLRADPHVLRVSVDHRRYRAADPTGEPYWGELWGLENLGQKRRLSRGSDGTVDVDIDARQALGITTGDPAMVVAVIDDGVDFSHPDLAARAWTNPGESGGGQARPTASMTTATATSTTSTAGTSATTTTPSTTSTTTSTGPTSRGRSRRRSTASGSSASPRASRSWPSSSSATTRTAGSTRQAIAAIDYAKSFGVQIVNASWGGRGRPQDALPLYNAIADFGDALRGRRRQRRRRQRHRPAAEPAGRVRPAEHRVGRGDRQLGRPRVVLELRQDDRRHRRTGRGDPERPACRFRRTRRAGAGWTARRWPRRT